MKRTINIKKIKSQLSEEARREHRIKLRMTIVSAMVGLGYLVMMVRAIDLHCLKNAALEKIAARQYNAILQQSPRRGKVLDRKGKDLAISLPVKSVYADPRMVDSAKDAANILSQALQLDEKMLLGKLESPRKFVWLKRMVKEEEYEAVKSVPGVYMVEESKRFYPNGEVASQLLGAVGFDSEALGGVERAYDKFLSSKRRDAVYKRDARGRYYFSPTGFGEQDDVDDVYLTIDKQIQFVAETALEKSVEMYRAKGGTAIVMDVATGAIFAMANMPTFDPNDYSKYDQAAWRNRAITDIIEPGSIFKALIVAAAIESGAVTPESVFNCERGAITVGKAVLHDHNSYGELNVRDIIKVSSNIGALKVAREVGKERLYDVLRKFGIGKKTGIDFPGEVAGIVRPPETWQPVEFGTIAFGQGIGVTPIQMLTAFAAIANDGDLMQPYILDRIVNNQGIDVVKTNPVIVSNPISEATSEKMIDMLERVVMEGGTGTKAASREYQIAGKTGTAQKVAAGTGRYGEGKYYASFTGLAPSNEPRIAVFVGIDEPQGDYYGGTVAAPAFREIVESALKYLAVPSSLSQVVVATNETDQDRDVGQVVVYNNRQKRFRSVDGGGFQVPDLQGATMREVFSAIGQADVELDMRGSGLVVAQSPSAGDVVRKGELLTLSFRQPE